MKKNRKIIIAILSVCLVAALTIGGSIAFLTDKEEVTNTFTVGNLDITLDEPTWEDTSGEDLMPGDVKVKDPTVTEVKNDSYMRMIMTVKDTTANEVITDANRLDLILKTVRFDSAYGTDAPAIKTTDKYSLSQLADVPMVNSAFTADDTRSSAGVYYYNYNGVFTEGSKVVLFTNIVIPTDYTKTELDALGSYQIEIRAEAIQNTGFADADEAFTALDEEITKANANAEG